MPDHYDSDAEIIRAAYAEKVREAFKVFAENLGMGQNQKNSVERFQRSLELVRKARDVALEAIGGTGSKEPKAEERSPSPSESAEPGADPLSPEDQALIDQALAGTTGVRPQRRR